MLAGPTGERAMPARDAAAASRPGRGEARLRHHNQPVNLSLDPLDPGVKAKGQAAAPTLALLHALIEHALLGAPAQLGVVLAHGQVGNRKALLDRPLQGLGHQSGHDAEAAPFGRKARIVEVQLAAQDESDAAGHHDAFDFQFEDAQLPALGHGPAVLVQERARLVGREIIGVPHRHVGVSPRRMQCEEAIECLSP